MKGKMADDGRTKSKNGVKSSEPARLSFNEAVDLTVAVKAAEKRESSAFRKPYRR